MDTTPANPKHRNESDSTSRSRWRRKRLSMHHWVRGIEDLLLPPICIACQTSLGNESTHTNSVGQSSIRMICDHCQDQLEDEELTCQCLRCAARFANPVGTHAHREQPQFVEQCRYCVDDPMPFASVSCVGNYDGLLKSMVLKMKQPGGEAITLQVGKWLSAELSNKTRTDCDWITPMPVHWTRRFARGHNVAELLVESICRSDGNSHTGAGRIKPRRLLTMTRKTKKQGTLTPHQRRQNVKDCFAVSTKVDLNGKHVLLVDDVMTSGATATQAARVLKKSGVDKVHLAIVARATGQTPTVFGR